MRCRWTRKPVQMHRNLRDRLSAKHQFRHIIVLTLRSLKTAHNPEVVGSNPAPATNLNSRLDNLKWLSDLLFLYLSIPSRITPEIVLAPSWHLPWHQNGTKRIVGHQDKTELQASFPQLVSLWRNLPQQWCHRSDSNASLCRYLCFRCGGSNTLCWYRQRGSVNKVLNTF